jgi:DNA sulfur modification protein DndD
MANQISIESLTLTNFGPFYGSKTIDFQTKKNAPPHVLIGGQNGAGKTHVLRALYLAVAGPAGVGDLKNVEADSGATRFNFAHLLNRRAKREGEDACSVAINIIQRDADSGDERKLTLNREIRFRPSSPPDWQSWAKRSDNETRIDDADLIERLRDAFLPRHLARFFFFDAEKSQNFQLGEPDIVKGISRILGLWSYEALEEDLRTLVKNTNSQLSATGASNASVKQGEASGKVLAIKGQIKGLDEDRQRLALQKQDDESSLVDIEDQLKTVGAVDPTKLAENHVRRQEAAEAKSKLENVLEHAWELALPIELLGGLRHELRAQLEAEQKRRSWEDRKAAVAPQLPRLQQQVFGEPPNEFRLPEDTLAFYSSRLDGALRSLFEPPPEGIESVRVFVTETAEGGMAVRQMLARGSAGLVDIAEASRKLELLEEDVRRLDHEIRQQTQNVAAVGAGQKLHEQRAELRAKITEADSKIADIDAQKARLEAELTEAIGEEARWDKAVKDADRGRDLAARASAYRDAASELRKRASDRMRSKLSDHVGDLWIDIMGRRREFSGMRFDPYWNCSLVRKNGEKIPWDDLNTSAGQRQVRLLAFYEALRRLAQSVPPLVVDTPLGRLDKEVRAAVLDKLYLSDDGHQSIVLSTNAEIDPDGELFAKVRFRFGRAYTLIPHGKPDSEDYEVDLEEKYFDRKVGA